MAPTFVEAVHFWAKLGFVSFGGPAGQIAIMHRELVERRRWVDDAAFAHALNFCMLLPGPEALQLAIYLGWRLHGLRGGLVAGLCFILPAVALLMGLAYGYVLYGERPLVAAALLGLKAVVVALVVDALLRIGRRTLRGAAPVAIALGSFGALHFAGIGFPWVLAAAAAAGAAWLRDTAAVAAPPPAAARSGRTLLAGLLLWLALLLLVTVALGDGPLYRQVYLFFSQAALLTWGGAYAVLAYVNQQVVGTLGWVTPEQLVAGLALAETTPGPLVIVLQFIGFMSGWNQPGPLDPPAGAALAGLLAAYATFLPSFVLIFVGAPYVEYLRGNARLAGALAGITAAVVGVIAMLALSFGSTVLLPPAAGPRWALLAVAVGALVALRFSRVDALWVIVSGALAGITLGAAGWAG